MQFERWTATGFLSLGAKMLAEDDPVKMEMDIVDEQLDTTARTFMGLTVGCARCHDHKFDPIPQADYYSLAGIFKSSKTMENFKVVAQWHEYVLAPEAEREKLKEHKAKIEAKNKEIGRISSAENKQLISEARARRQLSAGGGRRASLRTDSPAARGTAAVPPARSEPPDSFDRGQCAAQRWRRKSRTCRKDAKGPFFAEYDFTVGRGGRVSARLARRGNRRGHRGHLGQRRPGAARQAARGRIAKASPDAGGWSVAGVFPLKAGNEYDPAGAQIAVPILRGAAGASACREVSRRRNRWTRWPAIWTSIRDSGAVGGRDAAIEGRAEFGAVRDVRVFREESLAGDALAGWTSPAAERFRGFLPKTREELAARYQELFAEADREWQKVLKAAGRCAEAEGGAQRRQAGRGSDGPAPGRVPRTVVRQGGTVQRARRCAAILSASGADQIAAARKGAQGRWKQATPDLPRAMGISESAKIADLPIHLRGSHWTLGEKVPRRFPRVIAGENQAPIPAGQSGRLQLAEWLTSPGPSAHQPGDGEPHLALALRPRHRTIGGQFRPSGRGAHESAAARLAGAALRGAGVVASSRCTGPSCSPALTR